jgi:ribonuclease P protein component
VSVEPDDIWRYAFFSFRDYQSRVRSTLPKSIILRGHNAFGDVLQHGSLIHGHWIRCFVRIRLQEGLYPESGNPVQFGFAVPKKIASSAVLRNRIKRLMRETVRLEKESLWNGLHRQNKTAVIVMMLRRHDPALLKKLSFTDIADEWHAMIPKILSLC